MCSRNCKLYIYLVVKYYFFCYNKIGDDMKKIMIVLSLFIGIICLNVKASDYSMYQLISIEDNATVTGEHFIYNFYYNYSDIQAERMSSNTIIFPSLKNISDEKRAISISIGIFNGEKKNIGTMNYCSTNEKVTFLETHLEPGQETQYSINIAKQNIIDGYNIKDVKYLAVLGENEDCTVTGISRYAGKTIEEIKNSSDDELYVSDYTKYFIYVVIGVIGLGILIFIIKFLLTGGKSRQDMIREQYKNNNTFKINDNSNNNNNNIIDPNPIINTPSDTPIGNDQVPKPEIKEEVVDHNPKNTNNNDDHGSNLFDMYK